MSSCLHRLVVYNSQHTTREISSESYLLNYYLHLSLSFYCTVCSRINIATTSLSHTHTRKYTHTHTHTHTQTHLPIHKHTHTQSNAHTRSISHIHTNSGMHVPDSVIRWRVRRSRPVVWQHTHAAATICNSSTVNHADVLLLALVSVMKQ